MKKILKPFLVLAAACLMISCVNVSYESSMPKQSRILDAFPENFIGVYKSDGDSVGSLVITATGFSSPEFDGVIGENLDIKPYSDYLVVNTLQEGYWLVYLSKRSDNGSIEVSTVDVSEDEIFQALQEITDVEVFYDEEGQVERVHVDPTDQEFKQMIESKLFEPLGLFTPVQK